MKKTKLSQIAKILIVAVLAVFSMLFFTACPWQSNNIYKQEITKPRSFEFSLINNGTAYEVTKGEVNKSGKTVIPATHNNLLVTQIGEFAFLNCVTITSVEMPNSIESIYRAAFANCKSLTCVEIPASVKFIGSVVEEYSNYSTVNFSNETNFVQLFTPPIYVPEGVFENCINLQIVTFAEESLLEVVGELSFYGCTRLNTIIIPKNVKSIGRSAFSNCIELESVFFENESKLDKIVTGTFENCLKLLSITIPKNVISIESFSLSGCKSLSSITVSNENTVYRSETDCVIEIKTEKLVVASINSETPCGVKIIGKGVFASRSMEKVEIPDSVVKIEDEAFLSCSALIEVKMQSVKEIGFAAFAYCSSLKNIEMESIEIIGGYGFRGVAFTTLVLPKSLQSIGYWAFANCDNMIRISIPLNVNIIERNAFHDCKKLEIYVAAHSKPSGWDDDWNLDDDYLKTPRPVIWGAI